MAKTYKRVAIAKVGEWPTGRTDGQPPKPFTEDMFQSWVTAAEQKSAPAPVIGLGHGTQRKANGLNGTPALGGLKNLVIDADPKDGVTTLYSDLTDVPDWVAERYPRRSVELWEYPDGTTAVARLAMLGDEVPAIHTLDDLEALTTDEGPALVAASAVVISGAAVSSPLPPAAPSGVQNQPSPQGPEQTDTNQEPSMTLDTTVVARALGLSEDADATAINEAATARLAEADASTAAESGAVDETTAESAATEPVAVAAGAVVPGTETRTVPAAEYDALVADAAAGREAREAQLESERVQIAAAAVAEGRILASSQQAWADRLAVDPDARVLLTAAADQGGFPIGSVVPVGQPMGHSVTAAANQGAVDEEALYQAFSKTPKTEAK